MTPREAPGTGPRSSRRREQSPPRRVRTEAIPLEAARILSSSLEYEETLGHVVQLVVPDLADYALLYLREADGVYRQAASAHAEPEKRSLLDRLGRIYAPDLNNPHSAVARVLKTRRPVIASTTSSAAARAMSSNSEALRIYRDLGPVSYLILPLVAHGELLGSLVLVSSVSGHQYDRADLASAELVAARAALAIDNARLYREAREAHKREVKSARLESQLTRARLETLRAQLNPHFLFNALNVVAMLVRRGANDDALNAVVNLSELLRRVLATRTALEVPLEDEIALVERYLEVEKLRFRDRLTVRMDIAPDAHHARVPSLVLQPLVENAIKHGIAGREGPGRVEIIARREGRRLVLEVRDNGPGFAKTGDAAQSSGIGLANTHERLARSYEGRYRFELGSADGGGACVRLEFPYIESARGAGDGDGASPERAAGDRGLDQR